MEAPARLLTPIDAYCERLDPTFWAEPVNAVTNAAFLIAAWLLLKHYQREEQHSSLVLTLTALVGLIGIGSFLFHTYANTLTVVMDVIPIMVFIFTYLYAFLRRVAGCSLALTGVWIAVFVAFKTLLESLPIPPSLIGSAMYVPSLLAIFAMAHYTRRRSFGKEYKHMALLFLLSLTFRTLDLPLCGSLPLGTHFLWHCLNAVVLYKGVRGLMLARRAD